MRRKLYSSRQVKITGIVYVPVSKGKKEYLPAEVQLFSYNLLRIKALIRKYELATS